jgi:hypothetical protein
MKDLMKDLEPETSRSLRIYPLSPGGALHFLIIFSVAIFLEVPSALHS